MKIYTIGNTTILGTKEAKVITGIQISGPPSTNDFANFLKAEAIGNLIEMNVGKGRNVIEQSLTDEQSIVFDTLLAQYGLAEERAMGDMINNYFDKLRGKF